MEGEIKKKFYKRWWFWVLAVFVLFIIVGASGNSIPKISIPAPAETGSTVADTNTKTKAPATMQTLLDISGSGSKSTAKFSAASDWDLNWSYDCSNFGQDGNFQVYIYNGNGTLSFANSLINQLGKSGADVEHYHNAGTFYLTVNSMCKWKIQVKG